MAGRMAGKRNMYIIWLCSIKAAAAILSEIYRLQSSYKCAFIWTIKLLYEYLMCDPCSHPCIGTHYLRYRCSVPTRFFIWSRLGYMFILFTFYTHVLLKLDASFFVCDLLLFSIQSYKCNIYYQTGVTRAACAAFAQKTDTRRQVTRLNTNIV